MALSIALTADLHWGVREAGDAATLKLVADLQRQPADLIILAGDIGAGDDFARCLELFADLPGKKLLVPGNHDIWVTGDDPRGDSGQVYFEHLPRVSRNCGFHYLDLGPLLVPEEGLAIAGTMNWYDYSWADDPDYEKPADWDERLRDKRFTRGRHNDGRFVRWSFTDVTFTEQAVDLLDRHLSDSLAEVAQAIVVTHHPAFFGINFPESGPPTVDRMLWRAYSGNRRLEELLFRHADRVPWVFSGHTHRVAAGSLGPIRGRNIGGDYDWKRLLRLSWPDGALDAREFDAD